jgi:hypothetical protein
MPERIIVAAPNGLCRHPAAMQCHLGEFIPESRHMEIGLKL